MKSTRVFLALLFLVASAHRTPAPIIEESRTPVPRLPAKNKVPSKRSPDVEEVSRGINSQSVHVVLTPKTQSALAYLKDYIHKIENTPFAGATDVRPEQIVEQMRETLSNRFRSVTISNGSEGGSGLVMLFDLQAKVGSFSGTHNTVSLVATFKNGGKVVQQITASGESTIPYPAFGTRFPKAVEAAFADFSQKLAAAR